MMPTTTATPPAAVSPPRSDSVWRAAWRRFRRDRVGLVSLGVVLAFLLLIVASASGLVARQWQQEVGVPSAPPHVLGPRPPDAAEGAIQPNGPNVDLSDIDPLAPRYPKPTSF